MTWRGDKGSCNVLSNVVKNTAQTMTSMQPALIMLTKPNIFMERSTHKIAFRQALRTE